VQRAAHPDPIRSPAPLSSRGPGHFDPGPDLLLGPVPGKPAYLGRVTEHAPADRPDPTPPPAPEPGRPRWKLLAAAATVLGLLAITVLVWQPWDRLGSCSEDAAHLIDEEARLCYRIPDGWSAMTDAEREAAAELTGSEVPTSGLHSSEDAFVLVEVHSLGAYFDGEVPDEELRIQAELVAVSSPAMVHAEYSMESEAFTIGDHDAATATASVPGAGVGADDMTSWVRATVVDLGEEQSVLWTMTVGATADLDGEDGVIAILSELHDSLAVQ
jgi:hypothetical protein